MMTTRESLVSALAAALLRNSGSEPAHLLGEPGRNSQAAGRRRLIARAAVALADDILAAMEGQSDEPALKLARPADDEPVMIDLGMAIDGDGD